MSQSDAAMQPSTVPREQFDSSQAPARGCKRHVPSWPQVEILDLIEVWGDENNLEDLCISYRNVGVSGHMANSLVTRGHGHSQ